MRVRVRGMEGEKESGREGGNEREGDIEGEIEEGMGEIPIMRMAGLFCVEVSIPVTWVEVMGSCRAPPCSTCQHYRDLF